MTTESESDECRCCGAVVVSVILVVFLLVAGWMVYTAGKTDGYGAGYTKGVAWGGKFLCHSGNALKRLGEEGQ